jgi:hypothetical protein
MYLLIFKKFGGLVMQVMSGSRGFGEHGLIGQLQLLQGRNRVRSFLGIVIPRKKLGAPRVLAEYDS